MTSRAVVLGGTGAMGRRVVDLLRDGGTEVTAASRSTGVDARTGEGLDRAFEGADVVVDCTNVVTVRRRAAEGFFRDVASSTAAAAREQGVRHLVVLSILNTTRPEVRGALGYYGGKAVHEETYLDSGLPVTVVATTAWFDLAEQFLTQGRLGPVAAIPGMTLQPVHPQATAELLAEVAAGEAPEGTAYRRLAGPELIPAPDMARRLVRSRLTGPRVVGVPFPLSRTFRRGALLPRPDQEVQVDTRRFDDWVTGTG